MEKQKMITEHNSLIPEGERLAINRIYFIVNPAAKNERSQKLWGKVESSLNIPHTVFYTEQKGHAESIVRDILQKTTFRTLLVSVGGDGTLHEVINGAQGYPHAVITSIPAGSGNDFVRGVQKTKNVKEALDLIAQAESSQVAVDIGQFMIDGEQRHFVNSIGIGIDAEVIYAMNQSKIKKWFNIFKAGKLAYIYTFIKKVITYKRSDMEISIDGKDFYFKNVWFIVVANQSFFGGGMNISPASKTNDGKFEVLAVHTISPLKMLLVFISVYWGGHLRIKHVDMFTGKTIRIHSIDSVRIQADGEFVGSTSVNIQVAERDLHVCQKR